MKSTISDISHQLKTPLAALAMYQEIIADEPDNTETAKEFSAKIGDSLNRIEQLIQSMLKITRLDTGNIVFEKTAVKCQSWFPVLSMNWRRGQKRDNSYHMGTHSGNAPHYYS